MKAFLKFDIPTLAKKFLFCLIGYIIKNNMLEQE